MVETPQSVLIVEDDAAVRQLLARFLQFDGYTPLGAASPAEALALAEAHRARLALALVDLHLEAGARGEAVIEALRAALPELPVATMSGAPLQGSLPLPGVVAHLPKPFLRADLLRVLALAVGVKLA